MACSFGCVTERLDAILDFLACRWPTPLNRSVRPDTIGNAMFDIEHDSPVPIHEQITSQMRGHIASGTIAPGSPLADPRAFAQQLLVNPNVTSRAYADLEREGVVKRLANGSLVVSESAYAICRLRVQDAGRQRLSEAVTAALAAGLADHEITAYVERLLAAAKAGPLRGDQLLHAIKKPTHETDAGSHRASQGIQDLSRKEGPRLP
jgi:GntR family transcriptional regulator